ncbi:MAG: sugar transferase [Bacteroidales bacterium]|jgi:lipopolysaccharide/colanic/teichoic acid biosynthesis glycosyltransferase|nr:sugar transferase [Bacteroidales bacterium]
MIRVLDLLFSLLTLLILFLFLLIIAILIGCESRGGALYIQKRVGKNGIDFNLYKFRSMRIGSDHKGLLTVGKRDPRITNIGAFIRKYKIDELPQLLNVLLGDMSLVGPRPEVRKYVDLYTPEQQKVLSIRPGITDYASIEYINENQILAEAEDPEKKYIEEIMPVKIQINTKYIDNYTVKEYFNIIFKTVEKIMLPKH